MRVSRYRLTPQGWLGAVLFVLPTPLAAWEYSAIIWSGLFADWHPAYFTALATLSLIGFVLLLVGREIVTTD